MAKMWAGRTEGAVDQIANDFNSSIRFDCKMYKQDILGSVAHAKMLAKELGRLTNIPVFHGMRHKGSKEQKYLNYESRAKNAFESFYIKNTP